MIFPNKYTFFYAIFAKHDDNKKHSFRKEKEKQKRKGKATDTVYCESASIYRRGAADQYFKD